MNFKYIIISLHSLHRKLEIVEDKVRRERFDLSLRDKDEIFIKHVELATNIGLLENTLSQAVSLD